MDRPKSGHRRHDTGSVTVVDLLRRQGGPVRIPSADETATVGFLNDLLGPSPAPEAHRGWLSKGAKLAGLAIGSLALCGSVVTASALTHHRNQTDLTVAPTSPEQSVVTGPGALRPDAVAAQLAPPRQSHHRPVTGRGTGRALGTTQAAPITEPPAPPPAPGPPSSADVVRAFFHQLAGPSPALATQLLAPSLLSDENGFDEAWRSMTHIEIESIRQNPDGTVQAVIRMLAPDGNWLRVVELLHVTDGSSPVINGAELLSAQRGG